MGQAGPFPVVRIVGPYSTTKYILGPSPLGRSGPKTLTYITAAQLYAWGLSLGAKAPIIVTEIALQFPFSIGRIAPYTLERTCRPAVFFVYKNITGSVPLTGPS